MPPEVPRTHPGPIAEAFAQAVNGVEPLFVPACAHVDDRGWSLMNQLQGVMRPEGQINYSVQNPGVVKAWHRHRKQTDFWICVMGHLKVGIHRETDRKSWVIVTGEHKPGVVIIPPPLWHGAATVGPRAAGLLYYLTHQYDPASPDEDRRGHDSIEGFPWDVVHR
jgi:dTDP-4-dehydrorhamnose 3,5-epimerase